VKELNINKQGNIHGLVKMSIFLLILVGLNPDWYSIRVVWWGIAAFSSAIMLFVIMKKSLSIINLFTIWMFIFFFWSMMSYFWSINPTFSVEMLKTLFINMVVFCLLSVIIQSEKDIIEILKLIAYAVSIIAIYMLFSMDLSLVGKTQIGVDILGEKWNGNAVGLMMAFATIISLVIVKNIQGKLKKSFFFVIMALTTTIALLTGSRKALFFIMFGSAMFIFLTNKRRKFTSFFIIALVLSIFYYLIMNVPALYNVLGWRLEGLDALLTGKGEVDSSSQLRVSYIEYGLSYFREHPLLGYGINNFRAILGHEIGKVTYSHNNYVELLVNIGLIGMVIHYFGYFYILKKIIPTVLLKKPDPMYAFLFTMLVAILIAQYGWVTYFEFLINLFLCLGFTLIKVRGMKGYENEQQ
jgi:O-antigen ligase